MGTETVATYVVKRAFGWKTLDLGYPSAIAVIIGATFERKVHAVRAHASQFGRHPDVEGFLRRLAGRAGHKPSACR